MFRREGTFEEERLLFKGDVRPVPPERRFKHEPTYRRFLDEPTRDAYALRYEPGDVIGFVVDGGTWEGYGSGGTGSCHTPE